MKPTKATQGSTYDDNEGCCAAAHAIDKSLASSALTKRAETNWIKIEFGKIQIVHKVIIYYRFYNNWFFQEGYCSQSIDRSIGPVSTTIRTWMCQCTREGCNRSPVEHSN